MRLLSALFVIGFGFIAGAEAAPTLQSVLIPDASIPAGCQRASALFPVNQRVTTMWNYRAYEMVLPPYKRKEARSFDCGGQKGTLYYFEYASAAEREKALLFARPVLSKGDVSPVIEEWEKGFVIFSFKETPEGLKAETLSRLSGASAPRQPDAVASTPKPAVVAALPVHVSTASATPVPSQTVVEPTRLAALPRPASAQVPTPTPTPKPAAVVALPVPVPTASQTPVPAQTVAVPNRSASLPRPLSAQVPIPTTGQPDLNNAVLESYALKFGCQNEQRPSDVIAVCVLMQDFAIGMPIEPPLTEGVSRIGPIYTIDSYGRFTSLQKNVLVGTSNPRVVSYFLLPSKGGQDDFEINSLIEARQAKTPLPMNGMRTRIQELAMKDRFGWSKTNFQSMTFQPVPDRRLYVRRSGDRLIVVGTSGKTFDEQTRSSLVVSVLY